MAVQSASDTAPVSHISVPFGCTTRNAATEKSTVATSSRFKPNRPGFFYVFAVYCRNDQALSETTAWTPATAPNDPRIAELFRELFQVVWSDSPALRPQVGGSDRR